MRSQIGVIVAVGLILSGCGSEPKPATTSGEQSKVVQAPAAKPADESSRFPTASLADTKVVDTHLLGKDFMPGGTVAHYKKGKLEYDMFATKLASPNNAAILLPDWRKALEGAKFVASFGGYYGSDGGRPVFVFTKGAWLAGVVGLPEKDADMHARVLAAALH